MVVKPINLNFNDIFSNYKNKYKLNDIIDFNYQPFEINNFNCTEKENIFEELKLNKFTSYLSDKNNSILFFVPKMSYPFLNDSKNIINSTINNYLRQNSKNNLNMIKILGILNVTPDSFSDGGLYNKTDIAVNKALEMFDEGADIIDIGGESTRPGSDFVSVEEEINRVIPVIKKLKIIKPEIKISIDTSKSKVAEEAIINGADIVNDISGLTFDNEMINIVSKYQKDLILMHIKGTPKDMQDNLHYYDVITEIYKFLFEQVEKANAAGIKNVIIDPGIGFGKSISDNYEIIKRLDEFKGIGKKILIGLSKKSFLGNSLNISINNRENATIIAETLSILNGADYIRTHNIKNIIEAKKIIENIYCMDLIKNV